MAAPDYVPAPALDDPRVYQSPPWRGDAWTADRPGDLVGPRPTGAMLGDPGPDAGYALRLARAFHDRLVLGPAESAEDVVAGCVAVAMRRASMFGRGPIVHDLTVAFTLWGFLAPAPTELVEVRSRVFASLAMVHHYTERRALVDTVPSELLRLSPADVAGFVEAEPAKVVELARAALAAQSHD